MILDFLAQFTGGSGGIGNNDGATDSPTTGAQDSSQILDLHNTIIFGGNNFANGIPALVAGQGARDMGIGDDPALKLLVEVTTAFATGTNMTVSLQGAPDNGSGAPGSFTVYATGATVTTANLIIGTRLLDIDMPRPPAGSPIPRFLKMVFTTTGSAMTAGKVRAALVLDRHDQVYNGTINSILGGYPPGIVVAN